MSYEDEWNRRAAKGVGNVARAQRAAAMEASRRRQVEEGIPHEAHVSMAVTTTDKVVSAGKKPGKRAGKRAASKDD